MRQRIHWPAVMPALLSTSLHCAAQAPQPVTPRPGQILVSGAVPDESSKAAMLQRLRDLYGADRVVDQLAISPVSLPPNWNGYVQKLIQPNLKLISKGELKIDGTNVTVRGEVANEAQRQQIASDIATSLNPSYTVNNGLRVSAAEQNLLDETLAKRIIEFESGKATLTVSGKGILDEMAAALQKVKGKKVEVIGHTDNVGLRESNLALSQARAEAVRTYLAGKGIPAEMVTVSGQGPDRPVAENSNAEGRARNRRIEFRVAQ
ncbi:OmpA family protein [Duganella violaceipulchra]|uniref:OOP family OmpA-OmpF porin n=1 Tax=Duganella violaceipulchra TaxID=2849652 RepID=A0AA41L0T4_9BURK|nr:OmpA family protein [Duganella violaceicalia]MBV6323486.1 OmpA family protein [Duganella violaceicalia]MCP2008840.1 OOP family OmpA-OmpF porin [Duganella violaceicalia]